MPLNLRYLEHNEIDFERWDRCVGSRNKPQPYGFSWYLNWVAPGWTAIVYGDYEAVLPVFPKVKKGFTFTTRPARSYPIQIPAKTIGLRFIA